MSTPLAAQPTGMRVHAPAEITRDKVDDPLPRLTIERWDITDVTDDVVTVYVTEEEFGKLQELGYTPRWLEDDVVLQWVEWLETPRKVLDKSAFVYPTYQEMTDHLQLLAAEHPTLFHLESIGQSVQERELWFARITGPPEAGPAFRPVVSHIATMHGDEKAGTPLAIDFMERLLDGYGEDEDLTWLVNNTEIWIMPLMNPDGYTVGPNRRNNNNIDLNRDFPSWICGDADTTIGRQPETAAVMNWSTARNQVTLQANYHGGALVVNYPLDECPTCNTQCSGNFSMEDPLLREIALAWSTPNQRMFSQTTFPDGVINGTDWYSIYGSMQDWHYRFRGCIEVTVELDNNKIPGPTLLEQIVLENRQSVVDYTMWAHRGLRGYVVDEWSGAPVEATVSIAGGEFVVRTDPATGGFHRPLLPGVYTVVIDTDLLEDPRHFYDITITEGIADPVEFALEISKPLDAWLIY